MGWPNRDDDTAIPSMSTPAQFGSRTLRPSKFSFSLSFSLFLLHPPHISPLFSPPHLITLPVPYHPTSSTMARITSTGTTLRTLVARGNKLSKTVQDPAIRRVSTCRTLVLLAMRPGRTNVDTSHFTPTFIPSLEEPRSYWRPSCIAFQLHRLQAVDHQGG